MSRGPDHKTPCPCPVPPAPRLKRRKNKLSFLRPRYVGDWANDTYHGHGRFVSAEGVYEGGHFEGEWEGYGVYRWANGDVYDGQFEGNERHGLGRKLYADGRVEEGLWQHDEFVAWLDAKYPAFTR